MGYKDAYLDGFVKEGFISSPRVRYKAYPVTAASLSPLRICGTDATMHIKITHISPSIIEYFLNVSPQKKSKEHTVFYRMQYISVFRVTITKDVSSTLQMLNKNLPPLYSHNAGQPVLACSSSNNAQLFWEQNFTANIPLLSATSTVGLQRRY